MASVRRYRISMRLMRLRKISKIHGLQYYVRPPLARQRWVEQFYMAHIFDHDLYGSYDGLIRETTRDLRD